VPGGGGGLGVRALLCLAWPGLVFIHLFIPPRLLGLSPFREEGGFRTILFVLPLETASSLALALTIAPLADIHTSWDPLSTHICPLEIGTTVGSSTGQKNETCLLAKQGPGVRLIGRISQGVTLGRAQGQADDRVLLGLGGGWASCAPFPPMARLEGGGQLLPQGPESLPRRPAHFFQKGRKLPHQRQQAAGQTEV
jgi:hypothetical protein